MRCCCSLFRKNTDFICPPRAGMNCTPAKLRWLFWNAWLHTTALKASHSLVCVECKQRCVLQFAAWLTFLRQNKYTGTVVCATLMRDRKEQSKELFFHLHWNDYNLFICIGQGRGLISKVLTPFQKLADCSVPTLLGKGYVYTCKMLTCWPSYDHKDLVSD